MIMDLTGMDLANASLLDEGTAAAEAIVADARALQEAGCYSLVLESIPAELAAQITAAVHIPTIGIGAGPSCDGQVLVCYDLLGMNPAFRPKFLKTYASLRDQIAAAFEQYAREVQDGSFPGEEHSFHSKTLRLVREEDEDRIYGVPV
jgi:3-methyl-2-oxobutanoate hydroxymethyltransferase